MTRVMCGLLWETPGAVDELALLADDLLALAVEYGAQSQQRWQRDDPLADTDPCEMHMLVWPPGNAYDEWRTDPRIMAAVERHPGCLASWQTFWMHQL